MSKIVVIKRAARGGEIGLFPVDGRGQEVVGRIALGKEVTSEVKQARNTRQLRLFWVIVDFVATHCPMFEGRMKEDIADAIKVATGHTKKLIDVGDGHVHVIPRSIGETNMTQEDFDEFFTAACLVIADRWMPQGTLPASIRAELVALIDGPHMVGSKVA